jgi:hypothetical protein
VCGWESGWIAEWMGELKTEGQVPVSHLTQRQTVCRRLRVP